MKKILAILLVAVIATSVSFAGSWSSGPYTGTFTATVYCQPTLVAGTNTFNAGNFFQTDTYTGAPDILNWTLAGPEDASYSISMTGTVTSGTGATWNVTYSHNGTYTGTQLSFQNDCSQSVDLEAALNDITFSNASTGSHIFTVTVSVTASI